MVDPSLVVVASSGLAAFVVASCLDEVAFLVAVVAVELVGELEPFPLVVGVWLEA